MKTFPELTWRQFQKEVRARLSDKPFLQPVFDDIYDIARRLRGVDPTLFAVFNVKSNSYEIHSLAHRPNTFAWQVPWPGVMDGRVLEKALFNRVERAKEVFREMEESNKRLEIQAQKEFEQKAKETAEVLADVLRRVV